jgi:hypothetical protein
MYDDSFDLVRTLLSILVPIIAVIVGFIVIREFRRTSHRRAVGADLPLPLLDFSTAHNVSPPRPELMREPFPGAIRMRRADVPSFAFESHAADALPAASADDGAMRYAPPAPRPRSLADGGGHSGHTMLSPAHAPGMPQAVETPAVRFFHPTDGTLQFLPGRLEIIDGDDVGRDIRFVRTGVGTQGTEVTFGRADGPPYRHVQLRAATVSRRHALMSLDDGLWTIENISSTNPVIVNGGTLNEGDRSAPLHDGDRIELGEIVFRFRER